MNKLAVITLGHSPIATYRGYPIILTQRQREVLLLLCEGLPNKLISRRLNISDATVKTHVASVLRSLNASTRLEAVILAFRLGLVRVVEPELAFQVAAGGSFAVRPATDSAVALAA